MGSKTTLLSYDAENQTKSSETRINMRQFDINKSSLVSLLIYEMNCFFYNSNPNNNVLA